MEQQNDPQFNGSVQNSKNTWVTIIAVVVTALIVGGGVYVWQKSNLKSTEQSLQQQITYLQSQIERLQQIQKKESQTNTTQQKPTDRIPTWPSYEFTFTNKNNFPISREEFDVLQHFTVADLENKSQECGTNKSQAYFSNLLSKFASGDKGYTYEISYTGQTQGTGIWEITIIPNKLGYKNINGFKNDFDLCYAGGSEYPKLISENYLLFVSSCGTGFDDGSGLPHGCDAVRESIEPTIVLK